MFARGIKSNFIKRLAIFAGAIFAILAMAFTASHVLAVTNLQPGEVKVSKTAKAVDDMLNTWDIELNIQARDSLKTSDTVLVIDRSTSMGESGTGGKTKLQNAKDAAVSFVDKLLPAGNTLNKIAIVSFGNDATKNQATFSNNATNLKSTVSGVNIVGTSYTHTQLGLKYAEEIIATSEADIKNIVFLSDGEPTRSTGVGSNDNNNNICSNYSTYVTSSQTNTSIPQGTYNYSRTVGTDASGTSSSVSCTGNRGSYRYSHSNSAIAEAGFAKNMAQTPTLYTVALSAGTTGTATLNSMASPGSAYTGTATDLQSIFDKIAGNILAAAKNITISDTVASQFKIVSYNSADGVKTGQTVAWNNVQLGNADGDGVRTATKTIRIQLADDANPVDLVGQVVTNTGVSFKYKDHNNNDQTKTVPSPKVNPVLIHTQKIVDGPKAQDADKFTIKVVNSGVDYGAELNTNGSSYTSTKAVKSGEYNVSEDITGNQNYDKTFAITSNIANPPLTINSTTKFTLAANYQSQTDAATTNNDIYVKVTNKYNPPTTSFTVTKQWVNGPATRPDITVQLKRNGVLVDGTAATIHNGQSSYTWNNLIKTDPSGANYTYSAVEINTPDNYEMTQVNNSTIKNTYKIPTGPVSATKIWSKGENAVKPTVYFKLYRQIGAGAAVAVPGAQLQMINGTTTSAQWTGLELTDSNGNAYTFSVKEVNADGTPFTSANYSVNENGLTVTNTYKSDKRTITVNKTWVGGKDSDHTANFTLYQNGVAVPNSTKTITGNTSASWTNLPVTDEQGNIYTYAVGESAVINYESSCGFLAILCAVNGNGVVDVTNTYKIPTDGVFTATKVWVGGPLVNTPVQIQLYQNNVAYEAPKTTVNNIASWTNLPKTDSNGVPHTYSVKEVTGLANYSSIVSNVTPVSATITNKYTSPKTPISAEKTWVGGDAQNRPVIYFQLYRTVGGGSETTVGTPQLVTSSNVVNFGNQDTTDNTGNAYSYFVREVNSSGTPLTPANYTKSENGLAVTNTYYTSDRTIKATKNWAGGVAGNRTATFTLYQDGVQYGDVKTVTENGTASWTVPETRESDGHKYVYTVDEDAIENYTKSCSPLGVDGHCAVNAHGKVTITNTYKSPKIDVTVNKVWSGGKSRPTVNMQLSRSAAGVSEIVGVKAIADGQTSATWTGLAEFNANGVKYTYTVLELNVPATYTASYDGLTVTNTYQSPRTSVTANKVWVGGPAVRPTIQLQLVRNGTDHPTAAVKTLTNGQTTATWTDLEKTDASGANYVYTVREVSVPANYTDTYSQDGLTVTNTYSSPVNGTYTATKNWVGGPAVRPTIQLQLKKDGVNEGNPVTLTNGTTSYTWTGLTVTKSDGTPIVYTADEVSVPANYTKSVSGNTITNTYGSPVHDETATKLWDGGADRPDVTFSLYRNISGGTAEKVGDKTVKTTSGNSATVTWNDMPDTDANGNAYTYFVVESTGATNYKPSGNGMTITNTYESPVKDIRVTKKWDGGADRPDITVVLTRDGDETFSQQLILTADDSWTGTFTGVDVNKHDGTPYTYRVNEAVVPQGYTTEGAIVTEDGQFEITNTYVIPTDGTVTATKLWSGGDKANRPDVTFNLYRQITGGARELLDTQVISTSAATDQGSYTWTKLAQTDFDGNVYTFTVEEADVPANYTAEYSDNKLTVTNVYTSPKITYSMVKVWHDTASVHPAIKIQLFRNGEPLGDPIVLQSGQTTYEWTDLDQTDIDGNLYTYTVDELDVPAGYIKVVNGNVITNHIIGNGGDPKTPTVSELPMTGSRTQGNPFIIALSGILVYAIVYFGLRRRDEA